MYPSRPAFLCSWHMVEICPVQVTQEMAEGKEVAEMTGGEEMTKMIEDDDDEEEGPI
jgi:hypothetical protein